ncbi:MAG: chromate resistance protein ChrB domain-containing protein [Pseudomonadota bacterium]
MPEPTEVSPEQLINLIGRPDCPAIVDVSTNGDVDEDPFLIPTAFRHSHTDATGLADRLAGRASIIVCQRGRKLSQGIAAWLRSEGVSARYLRGGNYGWRAVSGAPRIPIATMNVQADGRSFWTAEHRPDLETLAVLWLIRRFVDRKARILFVNPSEVEGAAERLGAIALSHTTPSPLHGSKSAPLLKALAHFHLWSPSLDLVAQAVEYAARSNTPHGSETPGLQTLYIGLLRQHHEDQDLLDGMLPILDALYLWAGMPSDPTCAHQSSCTQ